MSNSKFRSFPIRSFPKENNTGTSGNLGYFRIRPPVPKIAGTGGNDRERPGTGELLTQARPGPFFHWRNRGEIENQGHLLELDADGHGRAQLFSWLTGWPTTVVAVTPDYLGSCTFYATCEEMNAAYAVALENTDD